MCILHYVHISAYVNPRSMGIASDRVRQFIIRALVKGMLSCGGTANNCDYEGSTSVFTERRFRDRWNRTMIKRISAVANHFLKVKARVRARGARSYGETYGFFCGHLSSIVANLSLLNYCPDKCVSMPLKFPLTLS